MSLIRPLVCLAALLAALGMAPAARAQKHQPFIDNMTRGPTPSANTFPEYFDTDYQLFAPAEVGSFGGPEPANIGWYFDYDKLYSNITRPDGAASNFSEFDGDFTWGNRYELGYMTEDNNGWQAVMWHFTGPNEYEEFYQERINRYNEDDGDPDDPVFPIEDRNPRYYLLRNSVNVASFSSFEFNKVWRRKEFHNGTVLEPLMGFRYMNFKNFIRRDNYSRFLADPNDQPAPGFPTVDGEYEQLVSRHDTFSNNMIGGQLGARLFHQRGHWLISTEVRMFGCANFQQLVNRTDTTLTLYDGFAATGTEVQFQNFNRNYVNSHADQFTWGGEVRAEAAYELTREISLRFGFNFIDLGRGIGRSNNIRNNDEDVQIAGANFGITVNR